MRNDLGSLQHRGKLQCGVSGSSCPTKSSPQVDNTHPAVANGLVKVFSAKSRKIGGKFEMRGGTPLSLNTLLCYCFYIYGEKITRTFLFLQPHFLQHVGFF